MSVILRLSLLSLLCLDTNCYSVDENTSNDHIDDIVNVLTVTASDKRKARDSDLNGEDDNGSDWSHLEAIGKLMSASMRSIASEELDVTHMQRIYDELSHTNVHNSFDSIIDGIATKMETKLNHMSSILETTATRVEELFQYHLRYGNISSFSSCCDERLSSALKFDAHLNTQITKATSCDTTMSNVLTDGTFSPGINLTNTFRHNLDQHENIKWQYFLSVWGVHSEFPAYLPFPNYCFSKHDLMNEVYGTPQSRLHFDVPNDDVYQRHRDIYLSTVLPQHKCVVIVIDRGSALTAHQLSIAKTVSKYILNSLSHSDRIGLLALSTDVVYPNSDLCLSKQMANANFETKYHFSRFIDSLQRTHDSTKHVLGLKKAFEMIANTFNDNSVIDKMPSEALIVYISRGLLTSLTDAKLVMELISEEVSKTNYTFVINSYALIDDTKPVMYETTFLKEIAEMNFKKFNVKSPGISRIKPGIMVAVNTTDHLSFPLSGIYSVLTKPKFSPIHISLPYWDVVSKDVDVSITKAVLHRRQLLGVIGLDISLSDLAEDIIYYDVSQKSYAFLIENSSGIVIHHPSFTRPSQTHEQLMDTDIVHVEQRNGFEHIKKSILSTKNGTQTLRTHGTHSNNILTYYWRHITSSPYIVVIAAYSDYNRQQSITSPLASNVHFAYHRLDLTPNPPRLCRHLKQLASIETATLFLSSNAFLNSYDFLSQEETTLTIQRFMAYLTDNSKLIANPGLKPVVRGDVHAVTRIIPNWKAKLESSDLSKFIVRKYITTPNGVFLVYPGALIDKTFDPTRREWYLRAIKIPGKVVFTAPYLDVGGAGYIVTLSHTIFEAKPTALHSINDQIVAVMAMDFTLGYFHKFLQDVMPFCGEDAIACFIMDDRGYLIAHPSLVEPSGRGPIEQQHITHKEPLVANDLLNHKYFVKKNVCNSYSDRTIQRFYHLNTSLNGLLTNLVHGDPCAKYQITSLSSTNIFIGIVNHTCDAVTAFCPCSMTDRLCLNCHRMEQTDCECPCECPLEMNLCSGKILDNKDHNPSCPPFAEHLRPPSFNRQLIDSLQSCFEMRCYNKQTENECLGVLGCEWCQLDINGETRLKKPYCNYQHKCFGGILGAKTPYADEITDLAVSHDDYVPIGSAPVGPVAGGIMVCFIILALSVYCYRYHTTRHGAHFMTSITDNVLHHSHFDIDYDENEPQDDITPAIAPINAVVLASFENAAQVSPYRINPAYRRPGGDSDHGYSTMTPHEDSEMAGPAYIEPLLVGRDKFRVGAKNSMQSDVASDSSLASTTPSFIGQTSIHHTKPLLPSTIIEVPRIDSPNVHNVEVHIVDTH